ncbi:MAG: hypothetical protein WC750_02975 [Patescibacteria group bacterium]|jgi:hypothetical protein
MKKQDLQAVDKVSLRTRKWREPKDFQEWIGIWNNLESPILAAAYLETAVDFYEWRPQAISFLMRVVDADAGKEHWKLPKRGRCSPVSLGIRLAAAEILIFSYLKYELENVDFSRVARYYWIPDFIREPALFGEVLHFIMAHAKDDFFMDDSIHTRSAVKKFLKLCTSIEECGSVFYSVRYKHLADFFRALIVYGMPDLIDAGDIIDPRQKIAALEEVVFHMHIDPYNGPRWDVPSCLEEALASSWNPLCRAAEQLLLAKKRLEACERFPRIH